HFYHLYTVWIALFNSLGGLRLSLWATTLFGLLSIAALWQLARCIGGARTAFLTCMLLCCSAAAIWSARFPNAEIAATFLILSGLFFLARYADEERCLWGWLAGFCLAEAMLTVFTAIILLPLVILLLAWRNRSRWQGSDLSIVIPLALGITHLIWQNMTVSHSYFERQMEVLRSVGFTRPRLIASGTVFAALLVIARVWPTSSAARMRRLFGDGRGRVPAAVALVLLFFFALYLRPRLSGTPDARNLSELGWFLYPVPIGRHLFPAGLFLALAGALLLLRDGWTGRRGVFLFIAIPAIIFVLSKKMIFPSYPWTLRRYMPVAFPSLILCMGYALGRLSGWKKAGLAAAGILTALLLCAMGLRYARFARPTDYAGTIGFLDGLASSLDRGGIFLCEGSGMAAPLDLAYGFEVLHILGQSPEKCRRIEACMEKLLAGGRRVYYISRGGWPISARLNFSPVHTQPLRTDHIAYAIGAYPSRRSALSVDARVFRVEPLTGIPEEGMPVRLIDIGEDAFGLAHGFSDLMPVTETQDGERRKGWVRWTTGEGEAVIPTFGSRGDLTLILRMSAGRERPEDEVPVRFSLEGSEIASVRAGRSMAEYHVTLPVRALPAGTARALLKIISPAWKPRGAQSPLGVCIDWISVAPAHTSTQGTHNE
ncbi:MAG: glycosyltransferase family 39 protein, partial [Candidatus Aureabacteria bacterium]|nr:glycosyltransferase family 39 protein [Candidatus Auribacterota bacterium]